MIIKNIQNVFAVYRNKNLQNVCYCFKVLIYYEILLEYYKTLLAIRIGLD